MNRIRKFQNTWQVLVTPHHRFDAGIELMMGNWMDENFGGFKVMGFSRESDAVCEAMKHPDISWDQMVLWNRENFGVLRGIIEGMTEGQVDSHLMTPLEAKNGMFDAVIHKGNKFRLIHDMHIISFNVYTSEENVRVMDLMFSQHPRLGILYKVAGKKGIMLVGKTNLGTTYRISLLC